MAGSYRYEIITNEYAEGYLIIPAEVVIHAFKAVLDPGPVAWLGEGGLVYNFDGWSCTVSGDSSRLELEFTGLGTRRRAERLTESLVRELEALTGDELAWEASDGRPYRESDASSGEVLSRSWDGDDRSAT